MIKRIGALSLLLVTAASLSGCFASEKDIFAHCQDDSRKVIEDEVGPITKFHFDKADYDPENDPIIEDDATIREGYAIVGGKKIWFQCSVGPKTNGNWVDVRDDESGSGIANVFVRH